MINGNTIITNISHGIMNIFYWICPVCAFECHTSETKANHIKTCKQYQEYDRQMQCIDEAIRLLDKKTTTGVSQQKHSDAARSCE